MAGGGMGGGDDLQIGMKVEARYRGKSRYYPGRIANIHRDGSCDIDYDDGETEQRVDPCLIKPLEPARGGGGGGGMGGRERRWLKQPDHVEIMTIALARRLRALRGAKVWRVWGDAKWNGIAAWGGKLYCAPIHASGVLVIDPQAGTTRVIECGVAGDGKWSGIAALGDKLYCAPSRRVGRARDRPAGRHDDRHRVRRRGRCQVERHRGVGRQAVLRAGRRVGRARDRPAGRHDDASSSAASRAMASGAASRRGAASCTARRTTRRACS